MLTSVGIENYRVLRRLEIPLAPLTVLVGPNGVGKSTTLEVLQCLVRLATGGPGQQVQPGQPEPWSEMKRAEIKGWIQDENVRYEMGGWPAGNAMPLSKWITLVNGKVPTTGHVIPYQKNQLPAGFPTAVTRLHLNMKILREGSPSNNALGMISDDGAGLAAALNDLKTNDDPRFEAILEAMKAIVPQLKAIKAPRIPNLGAAFTVVFSTLAKADIPVKYMSDGTLYALALLTALSFTPGKPSLVLLDDIDHGLHPKAQSELIAQIRAIQKINPGLQVIASSHSPYLVDSLNGDEVVLMRSDADGFAQARQLSQHPDYQRLKGALGTGEFWGSVGEEWISTSPVTTAGTP